MTSKMLRSAICAMVVGTISSSVWANESTIKIVGYVTPVCEVTFGAATVAAMDGVKLNESSVMTGQFEVNCNVPMEGSVTSLNGGLVNESARRAGFSGGADEVEYQLTLDFPGLGVFGPYASDDLLNVQTFDSGSNVLFSSTGSMRLDLEKPDSLFAGNYTDEIRIEVRPRE